MCPLLLQTGVAKGHHRGGAILLRPHRFQLQFSGLSPGPGRN